MTDTNYWGEYLERMAQAHAPLPNESELFRFGHEHGQDCRSVARRWPLDLLVPYFSGFPLTRRFFTLDKPGYIGGIPTVAHLEDSAPYPVSGDQLARYRAETWPTFSDLGGLWSFDIAAATESRTRAQERQAAALVAEADAPVAGQTSIFDVLEVAA